MNNVSRTHFILFCLLPSLRWLFWPRAEVWAGDGGAPPCVIWGANACACSRGLFNYVHSSRSSKSFPLLTTKIHIFWSGYVTVKCIFCSKVWMQLWCVFPGGGSCKWWDPWVLHKGVSKTGSVCWKLAQNYWWGFSYQLSKVCSRAFNLLLTWIPIQPSVEQLLIFSLNIPVTLVEKRKLLSEHLFLVKYNFKVHSLHFFAATLHGCRYQLLWRLRFFKHTLRLIFKIWCLFLETT